MARLTRGCLALASVLITVLVLLGAGLFVLFDSMAGRNFVQEQTEALVDRLLGADYRTEFGHQSISLGEGELRLRWSDVTVERLGVVQPQLAVRSVAIGLDGMSLLTGRIEARSLEIEGAAIDITGNPAAAEAAATAEGLAPQPDVTPVAPPVEPAAAERLLPALMQRILGQSERQLATLARIGIDSVELADVRLTAPIAPGGTPFVVRIEHLGMDLSDPRAMSLSGLLAVDRTEVPVEAGISFDESRAKLVSARSRIGPVRLGELVPPTPAEDTKSQRPFATDGDLTLSLDVDTRPEDGKRAARIGLSLGEGHVQEGRGHSEIESVALALDYLEGEDRIAIGPNRIAADGFEMALDGEISPVYDGTEKRRFNGFSIDLASRQLRSAVGSASGRFQDGVLKLKARTDLDARAVDLSLLDLRAGGGSLTGSATYRFADPDAVTELRIDAARLPAAVVKAFWPFNVALGARRWVEANVGDDGAVTAGFVALKAARRRFAETAKPGKAFDPSELEVRFDLEGLSSKSFGQLPELLDADGTVEVHGGDTLVSVASAAVAGMPDAKVEGGLVSFSKNPNETSQQSDAKVVVNLVGKVPALLAIAASPPLRVDTHLPLRADKTSGSAKVVADVDLLVGDDVPDGEGLKGWRVAVDLKDAAIDEPVLGRKVGDVDGTITVAGTGVEGQLKASLDGARGEVSFKRSFAPEPPQGRRMEAQLRMGSAELAKLAPALGDVIEGPVEASLVEGRDQAYSVEADLSGASLNLPAIGWRKGKGVDADLSFALSGKGGERGTEIRDLLLKGDGFVVSGRALMTRDGLASADLDNVALNPGDEVRLKAERRENGYSLEIKGSQFDARPLLADLRSNIGAKTATPPKGAGHELDVSASVAKVLGFGKETIRDFSLNYAGNGSRIAALSIAGKAKNDKAFTIDLSPRGEARSVEVNAEDAGALIDFTGAYGRMEGGKLSLSLLGSYDRDYQGKILVKDFTLVDEPRLSRLVASPASPDSQSLSQAVGRDLRTERATFDHASAGIRFGKDGLRLADGIIRGPVFGSSFAGTLYDTRNQTDITGSFMPAYGLNRVFGAIPVVGQILGNGREGGLIGITYRLSGALASPKLEINPISAIAPGIFRNIFAYQ
ncbi:membrane protein [Aureimonas endophytica]|uniref:Membrane protein n=1 Tax=Aureimonas endophytica TaxID=2027858 RepID=A0A916ZD88_9HYPH|nr:hypothetical protein [Aureimonas endophytica]GGD88598.1 membrane protein [Aureimonas endophytica]